MRRIEAPVTAAFERDMARDENAIFEDLDRVGEDMDIEHAPAGGVRNAVEVATDADHAFVGGAPFEPQDRLVWRQRQRLQDGLLLGEGLVDDTMRRRMNPWIRHRIEPMPQLAVQVVSIGAQI